LARDQENSPNKGVRRIAVRLGNWLTPEQGRRLLVEATPSTPRALRDHAMVAMLIGCGLRRGELLALSKSRKKRSPKRVLAIADLEHAKTAVLNSLTSVSGQRTYDHAIREFVAWYCSEPRLAFNRTVVLRYRIHLEQRAYAPATINLRLAAVRRIAYEAADAGLLSPELAAGIRRVKGVRWSGVCLGNWLTAEQGRRLLDCATPSTARELRATRWSPC